MSVQNPKAEVIGERDQRTRGHPHLRRFLPLAHTALTHLEVQNRVHPYQRHSRPTVEQPWRHLLHIQPLPRMLQQCPITTYIRRNLETKTRLFQIPTTHHIRALWTRMPNHPDFPNVPTPQRHQRRPREVRPRERRPRPTISSKK